LVFREQKDKKLITWCIIAFLFTYFIEFAGVRSGKIFGDYHYGKTMFIQILDVPVVIGMNWVILILAGYSIAVWTKAKTILIPILSSVLIVGFDFIMENVAIKLDYWQWKDNTVPLQNYFAWFIISLIFSSNLVLMKVRVNNRVIKFYFIIQLLFFIALRLLLP
jgi:putative membrane protein